jgi:hypothetical protein
MRCGDTLLIPAPDSHAISHLWIILTEPHPESHLCVIVSVTTLRNNQDQTVLLRKGEHPFIRHDSVISYRDAMIVDCRKLDAELAAGATVQRECCSSQLLMSWFSVKWRVAVFGKLSYSAAARREFSRHRGLSFDEVFT